MGTTNLVTVVGLLPQSRTETGEGKAWAGGSRVLNLTLKGEVNMHTMLPAAPDAQTLLQRAFEGRASAAHLARLAMTAVLRLAVPAEFGIDFAGYAESLRQRSSEDAHHDG